MKSKKYLSILASLALSAGLVTPAFADQVTADAVVATSLAKDDSITITANADGSWSIDLGVFLSNPGNSEQQHSDVYRGGTVDGTVSADKDDVTFNKTTWSVSATSDAETYSTKDTITASGKVTGKDSVVYTIKFKSNDEENGISRKADKVTITVNPSPYVLVDTTAPNVTITADGNANEYGWYNDDVTLTFEATDNESGIKTKSFDVPTYVVTTEGKDQEFSANATNGVGSTSYASIKLNIDKTKPTITGKATTDPNDAGWYNTDVTVNFDAEDNLSGVPQPAPVTLKTDGTDQSVTRTATDYAGNISEEAKVEGINIDKTNPVINVEDGGTYILNQNINWSAEDELSGLATEAYGTIDTSKVGPRTQTITATDLAGNTVTKTITYTVKYAFGGILAPINIDGSSIFKAGSTIPVKFNLKDVSGAYISTATASLSYVKTSDKTLGTEVKAVSTSNATTGSLFRYDSTSNQYIFNMSTKGLTAGTYKLTIKLDDTSSHNVQVHIK